MNPYVGCWLEGKFFVNSDNTETEYVPFLVTKVYNPTNVAGWYFTNSGNLHYTGAQNLDGDLLKWPDVPGASVFPVSLPTVTASNIDPGHIPDPMPDEGTAAHTALKRVDEVNPYTPESANA